MDCVYIIYERCAISFGDISLQNLSETPLHRNRMCPMLAGSS